MFDFFMGHWKVAHRRLKERLAGSSTWDSFTGLCVAQKTLGGFGNINTNTNNRAEDQWEGQPMQVRFLWAVPRPDAPRWAQAFSPDAGKTWETNWVMDFTRQA
jgi:hypothetical protein